ncbi:MAG: 16S rRNA (cytosine(967)-C(5))-methyltransferase RsmB [Burkholderiales bacterium]
MSSRKVAAVAGDTRSLARSMAQAARIIAGVAAGRSLSTELERAAEEQDASRASLLDLTHGTLRRYGRVQTLSRILSKRGGTEPLVEALLWCAFYALDSGRYAEYTIVDQAVRACVMIGQHPAKGFVNGVLRALLRDRAAVEAQLATDPEAYWQHPAWWISAVRRAHPDAWQEVLMAGNTHPPMCLRVNLRRNSVPDYQLRLQSVGIAARRVDDCALLLAKPVPVSRLPGFAQGDASVQDAGAQRAATYLELAVGQRVLDACAAPGGKSGHMLEMEDIALTALDADGARCLLIERNLARLGLAARVQTADCTRLETWWDHSPFDRILADVPCSSSGVVRRHPDIKWLRRALDLGAFSTRQGRILDALWPALAPGGKLLYVTCSVFSEENDAVVESFAARTLDSLRLPLPHGAPSTLLPGPEHDGFYFALLAKRN